MSSSVKSGTADDGDLSVTVEVPVSNTGDRAGAETVQVYVCDLESSVVRPPRELKGFAKIRLEPNESATATIELDQRAFSFWSESLRTWVVEAGEFAIEVGCEFARHPRHRHPLRVDARLDRTAAHGDVDAARMARRSTMARPHFVPFPASRRSSTRTTSSA